MNRPSVTDIAYRQFDGSNQDQIGALISSIQRGEFGVTISLEDQPDLKNIAEFYQKGAGNFWVAVCNEEIVGTVALLDIGNSQAALRKMFVHPEFRGGRGVALNLLNSLLAWAKQHELREIFLGTTDKFHAAHRFYEKNGFMRLPKEELPPAFPVMKVDSIFMKLTLS
jgi:N-acetylglutamate synthase-like GNAT family acetyltransferase